MKRIIYGALILLLICACNKSTLKVSIDTVTKPNPKTLVKGVKPVADLLNEGIKNIKITKDSDKGLIIIMFDYPSQKWPLGRNMEDKTWFEPMEKFLIRTFDKNGTFIESHVTGYFFPEKAFDLMEKDNSKIPLGMNFTKKMKVNPSIILKPMDNRIEIRVSAMALTHVEEVEFGFNSASATNVENVWVSK